MTRKGWKTLDDGLDNMIVSGRHLCEWYKLHSLSNLITRWGKMVLEAAEDRKGGIEVDLFRASWLEVVAGGRRSLSQTARSQFCGLIFVFGRYHTTYGRYIAVQKV